MEKRIKLFLEFLQKDKKLSNNTLQSYKRDITQYESYINEENLQYLKVTNEDIKKYLENLKNIGKKTSTISRNLASIRSFYQYLVRTKKVKEDPTEGIQSPKVEKRVPSVLSSKEVELLLEQPKTVDLKGIRDKAMLEFAYATGMRVTEIINLDIDDVNLKDGYVSCSNANKQRNIPLGAISINALKEYIKKARPYLIKNEDEKSLFVNINGKRLTDKEMIEYYTGLVKKYKKNLKAKWVYGMAIYDGKNTQTFSWSKGDFYFVEKPSQIINEGYPLDSISILPENGKYFVDLTREEKDNYKSKDSKDNEVVKFILESLN